MMGFDGGDLKSALSRVAPLSRPRHADERGRAGAMRDGVYNRIEYL